MRRSTRRPAHTLTLAAASVAAAAAVTLAGAAPALAATDVPGGSTPGVLSVSGTARPGSTVTFSGTCRITSGTEGYPTIDSVTSSAFSSVSMDRTDPEAFAGRAIIASSATAGTHSVVAHCSNGAVSSTVDVTGGHVVPSGGGGGHTGGGSSSSSSSASSAGTPVAADPLGSVVEGLSDGTDLPLVLGGLALAGVAGAGAYALGRGRAADRQREADRRAREAWEDRQRWAQPYPQPYQEQPYREQPYPQPYRQDGPWVRR